MSCMLIRVAHNRVVHQNAHLWLPDEAVGMTALRCSHCRGRVASNTVMRSASGHDYKSLSFQIRVVSERLVRIFGPCLLIQPSDTLQPSILVLSEQLKMQAQCRSVVSQPMLATRKVASPHARALPPRSQAISSHSTGFTIGQALCARPLRRALRRSRPQAARADVFFTQKTVPDQTGRVAIVTGTAGVRTVLKNR